MRNIITILIFAKVLIFANIAFSKDFSNFKEQIFPEVTLDRNLISDNRFGNLDLQSNYKVHNYDTNKFTNFLVNDFDWNLKEVFFKSGLKSKFSLHINPS